MARIDVKQLGVALLGLAAACGGGAATGKTGSGGTSASLVPRGVTTIGRLIRMGLAIIASIIVVVITAIIGTTTTAVSSSSSSASSGTVGTAGAGGAGGAGGNVNKPCDPAPAPDSFWAQGAVTYPDYQEVIMCAHRGEVVLVVNTAAI